MYPSSGSIATAESMGSMTSMTSSATLPAGKKKSNLLVGGVTRETGTLCCLFFCYLSVIPFLFLWFYHLFPTTVLSIIMCFALCSFIPITFNAGKVVVAEPVGPLLSAAMLACTALIFLGSMYLYWAHIQPMRALIMARDYKGVYPELPAVAFGDAAYVRFVGNTSVDVAKSVSMHSLDAGLNTFCVAPITGTGFAGRVEFWAVGVDCCGNDARGRFECDAAGQAGVKNAYVMQNPTDDLFNLVGKYIAPPILRRDLFMEAIAKAEHTNGVVSTKDAVLVRWTNETKEELIEHETLLIAMALLGNTALSVIMALFLTRIAHRFGELRAQHRGEIDEKGQTSVKSKFENLSPRFGEMYSNTVEDHVSALQSIDVHRHLPPPHWYDMWKLQIAVPYIVLMLCVILTTYSGCWRNGHLVHAPFLTLVGVGILALLATPKRAVTGLFLLLVALTGLYIGRVNYTANMFHYCAIEDRRTYDNVLADASSGSYWDAGILKFQDKAYLSQNHSVGFLYAGVEYCAAPILSHADDCTPMPQNTTSQSTSSQNATTVLLAEEPGFPPSFLQRTSRMHTSLDTDEEIGTSQSASQNIVAAPVQCKTVAPSRVEFWAIGTNCCGARKSFSCDGGKDANAHAGVLVLATGDEEPGGDRDQFFNAVSQAVAAYDLPVPDRPVLIRWGNDPKALQSEWKTTAIGMVLLTALIGLLALLGIGLGSFAYTKMVIKRAEAEQEQERIRRQQATTGASSTHSMWNGFGMFSHSQPTPPPGSSGGHLVF